MTSQTARDLGADHPPFADLLGAAIAEIASVLGRGLDRDWAAVAGDVDWSCHRTATHIADDLFSYASQVIAQPADGYLPVEAPSRRQPLRTISFGRSRCAASCSAWRCTRRPLRRGPGTPLERQT